MKFARLLQLLVDGAAFKRVVTLLTNFLQPIRIVCHDFAFIVSNYFIVESVVDVAIIITNLAHHIDVHVWILNVNVILCEGWSLVLSR